MHCLFSTGFDYGSGTIKLQIKEKEKKKVLKEWEEGKSQQKNLWTLSAEREWSVQPKDAISDVIKQPERSDSIEKLVPPASSGKVRGWLLFLGIGTLWLIGWGRMHV